MPYKDPEAQRTYQRKWVARRRAEWFEGKSCIECGSVEGLELDHVDPGTKVHHAIWSWSTERREVELAKCVVRCKPHHLIKSNGEKARGEAHGHHVASAELVAEVRRRVASGERQTDVAREVGVSRQTMHEWISRKTRKYE